MRFARNESSSAESFSGLYDVSLVLGIICLFVGWTCHQTDCELLTCIYILLTKHEGRTGTISARGLDSTDRAQRGPYKKDQGPIFSQDGPEQAWLIRDLLHD